MHRIHLTALLPLLLVAIGCGGGGLKPVPVSGTINYQGKPVTEAQVTFHWTGGEGGRSASGKTDAQGKFKLTTNSTNDGAVPGDYVITVAKYDPKAVGMSEGIDVSAGNYGANYEAMMNAAATNKGGGAVPMSKELPAKYNNIAESGLKRSVASGQDNDFTIDLE
jgi:hypothetical protein